MNYNLKVYLDLLPGAKVRNIEGKSGQTRRCVCIPIDNEAGTVIDAYRKFSHQLGGETSVPLKHIELKLTAFESSRQEFSSHYFKCDIAREILERMTEEDQRNRPIVGNMQAWAAKGEKAQKPAQPKEEDDW